MMNDPTTEQAAAAIECRIEVSLEQWPALRALREKLGHKAKEEKRFRFFSLYSHIWRPDTLEAAWATVRRNGGAPGVDQVRIEDIAASPEKEAAFLAGLQKQLREKTYCASPVRRVYIPKANGKLKTPRHPDHHRPRRAGRREAHYRADLRGRLRGLLPRVSTRPECPRRPEKRRAKRPRRTRCGV